MFSQNRINFSTEEKKSTAHETMNNETLPWNNIVTNDKTFFFFCFCSATFAFCDAQFVLLNDLTGANYPFQRNGRQFIRCPENLFHRIVAAMTICRCNSVSFSGTGLPLYVKTF